MSSAGISSGRKAWTYWRKSNGELLRRSGLEHMLHEERLNEPHVCGLEKKRLGVTSLLPESTWSEDTEKPEPDSSHRCTVTGWKTMDTSRNMGNSDYIQGEMFFTVRVIKHWSRSPREIVASLTLEVFKIQLDTALSKGIQFDLLWAASLTKWSPEVHSNLSYSLNLL